MRAFFISLLLLLVSSGVWAQERFISGSITDSENEVVIGANILLKGTSVGTTVGIDGTFKLLIPSDVTNPVLAISAVGYVDQEISVGNQTKFDIVLQIDVEQLEEVVVIGYGVQKKSDLTGAVSSVKASDLQGQAVGNAAAMLQGRASGVQVTQVSGQPGTGLSVRVRGTGTVNNSEPLYVVDGIFMDNISHINDADIESMEVLKDASATAIYGSRGANGVVLVTTKSGTSSDLQVNVDLQSGIQNAWSQPNLMNSQDYLSAYNTAQSNANTFTGTTNYPALDTSFDFIDPSKTTDWFDAVTRTGVIYKANVNLSKSSETVSTLFSVGYFENEGIINNTDYERINARFKSNYTLSSRIKAGVNVALANSSQNGLKTDYFNGVLVAAQRIDPLTPVKYNGEWASTPYSDQRNPVAAMEREVRETSSLILNSNAYLTIEPIKGLIFKSSLSNSLSNGKSKTYLPAYKYLGNDELVTNSLSKRYSNTNEWLLENTLTYTKAIGKHSLALLAGVTSQSDVYEFMSASRNNLPGDIEELQYLNASTDLESTEAFNSGTEVKMSSYLGRLNYSFDDRYLLTASFRRDGSSVFGPNNRYGTFPSAALAWKLRNESYMDFLPKELVSTLKVRAGWGIVGNANITPYSYTATVQASERLLEYSYVIGGSEQPGAAPVTLANPNIKWEEVESSNIGIDVGFLDDKLTLTADYFVKTTNDMLVRVPIPSYSGYVSDPYTNAGIIENKGFEIDLGYKGQIGSDFKYSVNVNLSSIKNEVIELGSDNPITAGYVALINTDVTRTEAGGAVGQFFGYEVEGVFQSQEEADNSAQAGEGVGAGDFKFKDQLTVDTNGDGIPDEADGVINGDDRTLIGNPNPDLFYGINLGMSYKRWDATFFFQGVQGGDLFNAFKYYNYATHKNYALTNDYKDHWTAQNGSNELFGLNSATVEQNLRPSDFYVEDGSYLRLKNMQIGYTFPENAIKGVKNLRLYFSGQNLFTITKYTGLDPEVGGLGTGSGGTLNQGVDYGRYPQSRVLSIGANVTF
ncbi:SusC/RagA family TonB-linked outer membrane protein [Sediminitomix flava]|uniref:TonB-linked SusC/RagA family outer membrane protein n=1 Tax=Sediminitomix flava TaxID=379075 RepID=A0A315Z7A8_SEDFL|nr:TonB-dependent receptor [Sediminitomix flava]PWJ40801.1 TonB-linked SusC/RagA family outer membrane protein [Sediminitomix flava]